MKTFRNILLPMVLAAAFSVPAVARAELPKDDQRVIEALLDALKSRDDLKFIRADMSYDAKTAAWYMKLKWDQNKGKVNNVDDFIALQSVGGEHGEITYYVQFADGAKKTAKDVLEEAVKKIREKKAE